MDPINLVLCAIDLSEHSKEVLRAAAEVAEICNAKLLVLHVVEVFDNRYDFIVDDIAQRIENDAREKVREEVARLGKTTEVSVEVAILQGAATLKIAETIRHRRPGLVVVGNGARGIEHLLVGSVAEKVSRLSPVPVLIVRPRKTPGFKRIVCGVDFSECSRAALEHALDLAALEALPSITVVNIFEVPWGYLEAGLTYESAYSRTSEIHKQQLDNFLKPHSSSKVACTPVVLEGPPGATLAAYAEREQADLLVVGTHGISCLSSLLLGGVSIKVFNQARMPVLAVKAPQHLESLWKALGEY